MSNPSYEYKKHLREDLPAGIEVGENGYYVVAETRVLPNYKTSKSYLDQLLRNGYDFTPAPEPETDPEVPEE